MECCDHIYVIPSFRHGDWYLSTYAFWWSEIPMESILAMIRLTQREYEVEEKKLITFFTAASFHRQQVFLQVGGHGCT